jgi:DNA repair exonuclease SbcCD ATPase subunit
MKKTFTELSVQYKQLTDEEKQSPFGQALASSLDQLKSRCNEAKKQLDSVNAELGNTKTAEGDAKSGIEGLTSALGINLKSLVGWGAALSAGKIALDVVKDAFFASESNIDEWGRTVEGAKGAYDVFLQTINSGNWSNFFQNLSTAVQGARDLYDALDRLGSVKSNNQAAIAIQQQQVAQLRLMKQQGQNVDEQLKAATERLAQLQMQAVDAGKVAGHATIISSLRNGINASNTTGVNISEGTLAGVAGAIENKGQAAFDDYKRQYNSLTKKASKLFKGTIHSLSHIMMIRYSISKI